MENTVYIKTYDEPKLDVGEILRYAQMKEPSYEFDLLLKSCIKEIREKLVYKVCWQELPIFFCGKILDLGFAKTESEDLQKNLKNCSSIVLFAATVGIEIDRMIAKYSAVSPAKALCFQAIGAERIESLCDAFCRDVMSEKYGMKKGVMPRFSPGYGDLPIQLQRDIFRVLDPSRRIGLTLNDSLLMSPAKSVTAIIGITDEGKNDITAHNCENCRQTDCKYRRII